MSNGEKGKIQCKINENDLIYSLYLPLSLKGENESRRPREPTSIFFFLGRLRSATATAASITNQRAPT